MNGLGYILGDFISNSSGHHALIDQGPIFRTFFPGKISGKIPRKIFPQKCWEKMEFSAEKVSKNRFSKKFRGIFRGK
jgi:hypothetical protein